MIHRAVKFGTRRFGNEIHPLVLPLRGREFVERWARTQGLPAWLMRPFGVLLEGLGGARARRRSGAGDGAGRNLVAIERFDHRIDELFARAGESWDLIIVRSRPHLDWRYCDERGGRFRKLVAEDGAGDILGYAIGSLRGEHGFLVDLLALPGREDAVGALIEAAVADLAVAGAIDVLCWLPQRHPYRAALRRAGFLDARELPIITFRHARIAPEELDFLTDPDLRIHFTLGDTDLV
jgi:hypothetical protein